MERKLAAILAADVVGYTRLMEQDEAGTFERLRAQRIELFEPEIKKHHGHVFKLMGDGLLAEFASVIDAMECAVLLQRELTKRNEGLADNRRIDVRIGVNLGEVIVEGKDRYGEGVNIAARLQQLAEPRNICVSGKVYDEVVGKLDLGFAFLGEQPVKNIVKPLRVYCVRIEGTPVAAFRAIQAPAKAGCYCRGTAHAYRSQRSDCMVLGTRTSRSGPHSAKRTLDCCAAVH